MHMNTLASMIVLGRLYDEISIRFSSTPSTIWNWWPACTLKSIFFKYTITEIDRLLSLESSCESNEIILYYYWYEGKLLLPYVGIQGIRIQQEQKSYHTTSHAQHVPWPSDIPRLRRFHDRYQNSRSNFPLLWIEKRLMRSFPTLLDWQK